MKKILHTLCLLLLLVGFWFGGAAQAQEQYAAQLQSLTAKVDRLATYVRQANWQEIRSYIRGPLGEVRREFALLSRQLPTSQRSLLQQASQKFLEDLVALDFAARDQSIDRTDATFNQLEQDFTQVLTVLPK